MHGCLLRYWTWLLPFGVTYPVVLFFGFQNPLNGLLLLIALLIHLAFFVSLALYLSVVCRTTVTAYVCLAIIMLVLFVGTLVLPEISVSRSCSCAA